MNEPTFLLVRILSTLADGTVAGLILLGLPWRTGGNGEVPSIPGSRLMGAFLALGFVFLVKLPLWTRAGLDIFGMIHLAYLHMAFTAPVLGVLVLALGIRNRAGQSFRRTTAGAKILAVGCLLAAPAAFYATWIEPFRLQTEVTGIPLFGERSGKRALRIGVLADVQTAEVTEYERSAVARLMELAPDVILIPGDFYQGKSKNFEGELPKLQDLLSRLSAPGGIYFVEGNTDSPEELSHILEGTGVRFLEDEVVSMEVGDRRILLGGISYRSLKERQVIEKLESDPSRGDIRILLAHIPDVVLRLPPETRIDLVVAGHTHGGQVQIPLLGPPITFSRVPRPVAAGGYHELEGRRIYVSRGIGCERGQAPRIRFLCPPEVTLLILESPKN